VLFRVFPHSVFRDTAARFVAENPLVSSFIIAAIFYHFWQIRDERTLWRRRYLIGIIVACVVAVSVTGILRPWLHWPSPSRSVDFRDLFPAYLWGTGTDNSFPSHSTLVYILVAFGFWPLSRTISVLSVVFVLLFISLPRIYVGGHYPIDVLATLPFAVAVLLLVSWWAAGSELANTLVRVFSAGGWAGLILFFWFFELAEGFSSLGDLLRRISKLR
jgi:membrane-associated phospholipid phosphatase